MSDREQRPHDTPPDSQGAGLPEAPPVPPISRWGGHSLGSSAYALCGPGEAEIVWSEPVITHELGPGFDWNIDLPVPARYRRLGFLVRV